ncbi:unnamed protein product, partial [Acanthoscelides obtectus]
LGISSLSRSPATYVSVSQGGLPPGKKRKEPKDSMDAIIQDNSQGGNDNTIDYDLQSGVMQVELPTLSPKKADRPLLTYKQTVHVYIENNEPNFSDSNNAVPKTTYASVTKNNPITPQEINSSNLPSQSPNTQTSINIPNAYSHFTQRLSKPLKRNSPSSPDLTEEARRQIGREELAEMISDIKAFIKKREFWERNLIDSDTMHFPVLSEKISQRRLEPSDRKYYVEIVSNLKDNFKTRYKGFNEIAVVAQFLVSPFMKMYIQQFATSVTQNLSEDITATEMQITAMQKTTVTKMKCKSLRKLLWYCFVKQQCILMTSSRSVKNPVRCVASISPTTSNSQGNSVYTNIQLTYPISLCDAQDE